MKSMRKVTSSITAWRDDLSGLQRFLYTMAGVFLIALFLAYLTRNMPPPPDCVMDPNNPDCYEHPPTMSK